MLYYRCNHCYYKVRQDDILSVTVDKCMIRSHKHRNFQEMLRIFTKPPVEFVECDEDEFETALEVVMTMLEIKN